MLFNYEKIILFVSSLQPFIACTEQNKAEKTKQPNIIFILADDMGYGDVSYFGGDSSKLNTVNLDRMASEGVAFMDAHSSSSVSTPTRYGILTGRYNWRSCLKQGVLSGYSKALIAPERETMASMLKNRDTQLPVLVNGIWAGIGIILMPV